MRCSVKLSLRQTTHIAGPLVVGILRPVIFLPVGALDGISNEVLCATLAHEVAHVVRWDFLVNLLQMGIEALLFFNPFVWTISQMVRSEREACCDLLAIQRGCSTTTYAEVLTWWARTGRPMPAGMLAMARPGSLLNRISRLLRPDEIPSADRGWAGAVGVTLAVAAALGVMGGVVHAAVTELTPAQRVKLMDTLAKPFQGKPQRTIPAGEARPFSGVVVDDSGRPVSRASWFMYTPALIDSLRGVTATDGHFSGLASRATTTFTVTADGWAPAYETVTGNGSLGALRLVLTKGHDFRFQCVDEKGLPVASPSVLVESGLAPHWSAREKGDATGWIELKHQPMARNASFTVSAPGFQSARYDNIDLSRATIDAPFRLTRTSPYDLTVLDEITGLPVAGVTIRMREYSPQDARFTYPDWNYNGATTDAGGHVLLDGLNPNLSYQMKAEAAPRALTFAINPRESTSQTIRLPRERRLHLKFLHLPGSEIDLQYGQQESENGSSAKFAKLPVHGGETVIDLGGFMPKPVDLYFLGQWAHSPPLTKEDNEFTVDYDAIRPPSASHVVIRFASGPRQAAPTGNLWVNWNEKKMLVWDGKKVPVVDGKAEFEVPAGSLLTFHNQYLIGGKVDEQVQYSATSVNTTIDLPFTSAGLIRVQLREFNGSLADRTISFAYNPASPGNSQVMVKDTAGPGDQREWYPSEPIPMSKLAYVAVAAKGIRFVLSNPFSIDAGNPVQDVVLTLPAPETRLLRVVDKDGNPLTGVGLVVLARIAEPLIECSDLVTTDADGVARIDLSKDTHPLNLSVRPSNDVLVPATYSVDLPASGPATVTVERGKKIIGRLITHSPTVLLSQCTVAWTTSSGHMWSQRISPDANGRFEFDNVPDGEVFLSMGLPMGETLVGDPNVRPSEIERVFEVR